MIFINKKIKKFMYLIILLILINITTAENENISELYEMFSFSINPQVPDKYINFEQSDNFNIKNTLLTVNTIIHFKNVKKFNFTQTWQSGDDTKTIFDLKITRNGLDTYQSKILSFKKRGEKYVATSKQLLVSPSDVIELSYKIGGAVKPVKVESFFNISLNKFFYPFDSYKLRMTYPPALLNIRERKIILEGAYKIDENKSYFQCPYRVGKFTKIPLIDRRTGKKVNFSLTFDFNLNNQKSAMKLIKEDRRTTLIFEPIRTTQGGILQGRINQSYDYEMNNESTSCVFNLQYSTKLPVLLIIILLSIIIIPSYISTNKYFNARTTKKRKYLETTMRYFVTPLIMIYGISIFWINRPIPPTILDISVVVIYLVLCGLWLFVFKKIKRDQFSRNIKKSKDLLGE